MVSPAWRSPQPAVSRNAQQLERHSARKRSRYARGSTFARRAVAKKRQGEREHLNVGMASIAAGETVVKHPIGRQPAHLDEPIDDIAGSGDREAVLVEVRGRMPI